MLLPAFGSTMSALVKDPDQATALKLADRLGMQKGEWFLDQNAGMDWRPILTKNPNVQTSKQAIRAYIQKCPRIVSAADVSFSYDSTRRDFRYGGSAKTQSGAVVPINSPAGRGSLPIPSIPIPDVWFLADPSLVILDGAGNVSSILDKSGNGFVASQTTAALRPLWVPNGGSAGGGALGFTGTQVLVCPYLLNGTDRTNFVVSRFTDLTQIHFSLYIGPVATGFSVSQGGAGDRNWNMPGIAIPLDTTSVATTLWEAWGGLVSASSGTHLQFFVNGSSHALSITSSLPGSVGGTMYVGGSPAGHLMVGLIDEVISYNRALAPSEISNVNSYLRARTEIW